MSDVNPVNYKIHLEPDLNSFKFKGTVEISLEAVEPVDQISLNILELALLNCSVKQGGSYVECPFSLDTKKEEMNISLPEGGDGNLDVKIEYEGEINDKMAGLYRSKYLLGENEKYIAVSQFEESDARRAFPCLDHPLKKATFEVEMIVDEKLVAISNTPITSEESVGDGRKLVKFQKTPRMSTYLLFLGVGEFEFIEDRGEVLVRVATMPGMTPYAKFGLEFGRKALEFSEDYYGIKYPLPKLDLIAIADFAAGAMENWGAITFRENLLLHYPNITSKAGEERICEVIAHEMAHQWFGNLVTPSDWKYLWLNESFATYFGYGIVTHYYPEWDIWEQFLHGQTDGALDRDALHETFPIEIPGGEHVVITASTAPIIYSKGGSILRQVEGYVGKENFKAGLRHYLRKHEYDCASSHHLWEALEEVSAMSVTKMMKSWIEQPGFPLVEVKRVGDRLSLTQKRFTYLDNDAEQEWLIPVAIQVFYRDGQSKRITTLLESKTMHLDVGHDVEAYKVNHEQTGFYRVRYLEGKDLQALGIRVAAKELSQEDRWGIQNDLYALVKSGRVSIDDYLQFVASYSKEDAFLPLTSIAGNMFRAFLIFQGARRDKIISTGKSLLERVLSDIGFEPEQEERHTVSILRDQILWHLALYESADVLEFGSAKFSSLMRGENLHPDIMRSVMQIGALQGDKRVFEWFTERLGASGSEHERMNLLAALGSFKDRELVERAQQYILEQVPPRNKFVPITYMAANPHAAPQMWAWYRSNLESLEKFHPMHYERVIAAIVPVGGLGREEEINSFFQEYMAKKAKAKDVIKLSLERLKINSRMRNSR
jgi:aminopeptidase N